MKIHLSTFRAEAILCLIVLLVANSYAFIVTDGRGFFRVAVTVHDGRDLSPVEGVMLTMSEAGEESAKSDANMREHVKMFLPQKTGQHGDAFVYYYGGFSSESDAQGKLKYSQQVRGKLKVEKAGFKSVVIKLENAIGPVFSSSSSLPLIEIRLEPESK
ncbi:MAG: hypothetical protein IPK32_08285 [Verrucomicrobiaceae bacterium]|nr:hypothetical protein [Verrucomicrobiaceae bacterium]